MCSCLQARELLCGGHGPGGHCGACYSHRLWKQEPLSVYEDPGLYYSKVNLTLSYRNYTANMLSTVARKHLLSCYIDLPSEAYVSPICQRQCIGEYNWIFPRGSTWSSLLALGQCSLPSLTVFSFLRGHSVTAASLVSVREIKPRTFGLGQKPVSVTVCNFLISDMLACLAAMPHCVELCEHLVDMLFGLCTAGILQRLGWAGSSLFRATVIQLQPALLNLCFFKNLLDCCLRQLFNSNLRFSACVETF